MRPPFLCEIPGCKQQYITGSILVQRDLQRGCVEKEFHASSEMHLVQLRPKHGGNTIIFCKNCRAAYYLKHFNRKVHFKCVARNAVRMKSSSSNFFRVRTPTQVLTPSDTKFLHQLIDDRRLFLIHDDLYLVKGNLDFSLNFVMGNGWVNESGTIRSLLLRYFVPVVLSNTDAESTVSPPEEIISPEKGCSEVSKPEPEASSSTCSSTSSSIFQAVLEDVDPPLHAWVTDP